MRGSNASHKRTKTRGLPPTYGLTTLPSTTNMPRRPLLSPRGLSKRVKGSRFFKFIQRLRKSRTQEEPHGPGSDTVIERPLELVDKTGVQPELLQDPDVGASEVFVGDHSKVPPSMRWDTLAY